MADLGEGDGGDRPSLQEKFFDFSQQKRTKMDFYHLERFLKNDFWRSSPLPSKKSPLPSKILDPPLKSTSLRNESISIRSKTSLYYSQHQCYSDIKFSILELFLNKNNFLSLTQIVLFLTYNPKATSIHILETNKKKHFLFFIH